MIKLIMEILKQTQLMQIDLYFGTSLFNYILRIKNTLNSNLIQISNDI